ncbi:MAG TPA: inorganic phosphate transporter [Acidimicrobiales bacterium]|nr:inorganic phosphate transporter [Acidimicrobiales bacterium]
MHGNTTILVLVVITGVAFDFTNGFHDSANAMATSIATGALKPRVAVGLSAVLNLAGAFLSLSVAATIASGIVQQGDVTLQVVFSGLIGGILWNVTTWYLGIPSSSSQALIGGVVGSTLVHAGGSAVIWSGIAAKVFIPMVFAPVIALVVATVGTWLAYRITARVKEGSAKTGYRIGQIGSASMVSLAHGTNDAQKTMGILTLALIVNGTIGQNASTPDWVIAICGVSMAAGTYFGGWRIIRTLGKGLTEIETPQGFAAEASSTAVILASTHFGIPLSTTQVCSGSVLGAGVARGQKVRWNVFGRMAVTWVVTLPCAGLAGAACFAAQNAIGGDGGVISLFVVAAVLCGAVFVLSRRSAVSPDNVNDDWVESGGPSHEPAVVV